MSGDVSIRAVLSGFDEGRSLLYGFADGLDKVGEKADQVNEKTKPAASAIDSLKEAASKATESVKSFFKGTEEASSGTKGVAESAGDAASGFMEMATKATLVAGALTAVGYAAKEVVTNFFAGISNVRQLGEEMYNMSQITGLGVERLGGLQLAAQTNNLSMQQLSQGVTQFNRHIIDATKETGQSAEAFDRLGISIRNQDGVLKDNDTLLKEVINRFAGMEDGAGKTSLAMELFGRAGQQMIPLLNEGAAGMEKMRIEAEKAGIVLSETTAKGAQEFNANLEVLAAYSKGFWMSVASPIVEGLAKITGAMREARLEGSGMVGAVFAGLSKAAQMAFGVGDDKQELANVLQRRAGTLEELTAAQGRVDAMQARGQGGQFLKAAQTRVDNLRAALAEIERDRDRLTAGMKEAMGGDPKKTAAPEKTAREPRGSSARGPSLLSSLNEQARIWKDMVTAEEMSMDDYIAKLEEVSEKYGNNEKIRTHFKAMAVSERNKLDAAELAETTRLNNEASKQALALLKRQEDAETKANNDAVAGEVKRAEAVLRIKVNEINGDANLTQQQKLVRLEALREEMNAQGYLSDFSKEWRNKMLALDVDIEKQRVNVANESARQLKTIFGNTEFDGVSAFKGIANATSSIFKDILTGHFSLTGSMSKLWKSTTDGFTTTLANSMSKAVLEPLFEPFKEVFKDAGNWVMKNMFDPLWSWIKSGFSSVSTSVAPDIAKMFSPTPDTTGVNGFFDIIKGGFSGLWNLISSMFSGLGTLLGGVVKSLGSAFGDLGGGIGNMFSTIGKAATNAFDGIGTALGKIFSNGITDAGLGELGINTALTEAGGASVFDGLGLSAFSNPFTAVAAVVGSFIFADLFGDDPDPAARQRYLDSRGITEAQAQAEWDAQMAEIMGGSFGFAGAEGGDMTVDKPTWFLAGEAGKERVQVTPMTGGTQNNAGGLVLNVNGPMIGDYYSTQKFLRDLERWGRR